MKTNLLFYLFCLTNICFSQLYFPPNNPLPWQTMPLSDLNWCQDKVDNLYSYLDDNNTKAFIVLKDGKIVLEQYFNGHTASSSWYWASAGKGLTAFLIGLAQQDNLLDINLPSNTYLGSSWSSCTPTQENAILLKNHLNMTTGLDDSVPNLDCTTPECLQFLATPGTRWSYHNAPYTLLDQVIQNVSGQTLNVFNSQKVLTPTGMSGLYLNIEENTVFFSTARSMARFGLLMLNQGNWNGNQIMTDNNYFSQMVNTSQNLNQSYGYLWWLNGKSSIMVPGSQIVFPFWLAPNAPADMYAALGKNGQFINVVPSQNLVFIRMGESPANDLVPFLLNDQIWTYINDLGCDMSVENTEKARLDVYPNPASQMVHVKIPSTISLINCQLTILNTKGQVLDVLKPDSHDFTYDLSNYAQQTLLLYLFDGQQVLKTKLVKM